MTVQDLPVDTRAAQLREALGDRIVLTGDAEYDTARLAWNLAVDQRPFAVARPESAEDVVAVVRAATAAGLRLAPQSTGHAAVALSASDLSDVVIVNLTRLRGVTVDPTAQTARVLGGSQWIDVVAASAPHGLTALHGSAGDVSVVGYSLSGGLSFYARAHGLAVGSVREVQLVTADGALVRASADEHSDLFWAVRGGAGAFGIVVSVEIDLLPYADVVAGMLLWDVSHAAVVTHAWAQWTATAPESVTTSLRILHLPPLPELPPFLSGRSLVVIDGAILETDAAASALLEPLRALAPEVDTFARVPAAALIEVHMDPPAPTPAASSHAVLSGLPADAVDAFVAGAATPGLFVAELRHIGGAAARPAADGGAVSAIAGEYVVQGVAIVPAPETASAADAAVHAAVAALEPWHADAVALTFIDSTDTDAAPAYGAGLERLRQLKAEHDPVGVFVSARPV
ncbi:FAD-binding oxidoreductase [Microbacterium sp. zg.Y625]|uniref:FAD-binding oxidoreductase n=1 Tax=Microbacterium jiangjiandongii TaxID=3049071 RepID=UPI00214CF049|nr:MULTISPECIES: FAD-binding oxidoreductase [unclassified Microbacterium]MCR2791887.1 FAD-binding oxidoreductase [Microbacterium sp. zg.Y625]WIM24701.1 FAD-binding oxidoreductase [Microbacterium sp. zg-Y625]